ncbi:methyltransferase domain-containing protein [Streptomyces sp. NPDC044948]|uniref:SAM-dependent methyltransferase n=1 Tax=Streptomyces sp. NPDC044948 TaxID=3157092 RepID=UPI00340F2710
MDRQQISRLAHADHPIAAPLDDGSVHRLLTRAVPGDGAHVLDLGCGGGEWLLRALRAYPGLTAEGVDTSGSALDRARAQATRLAVGDRLTLHHRDAARFTAAHRFDLVLCVGSTHAFGGLSATLAAARAHLTPQGRVLVGDGYWERPPSSEAVDMLGDLADLPTTLDRVVADGWTPVGGHISTRQELDDYEWSWTGALADWALRHPDDPDRAQVLETAGAHRESWLRGYRDTLGFLCLVLRPTHA